ncbi:phosphatidylglycerol lysyltransferase domain-containing protein [Maridesulfovibrio sp.]|uniref:phosphatidylglycerol lysyltransferase domain-containing protein n=1 Tax=Maridesulfovibrio sp. TaxID=2795000 RepID=UPI002A18C399|nr:phosphatidylglycerol lysyltransferase domain-containing protein [Maridesulfovibrio sp.]
MNLNNALNIQTLNDRAEGNLRLLFHYLQRYGNRCASYSVLQPGMSYSLWEGVGFAAWLNAKNLISGDHAVVLSNPVVSAQLQQLFVERLAGHLGKTTLVQIDENLARQLYLSGFRVYQLGVETELDIGAFNLEGGEKASLRQWKNKCLRAGITVEEKKLSEVDPREVSGLCASWLQNKGGRELSFLTRPMPGKDEKGVRFFWARSGERLVGLAGFDPIYSAGRVIGYYHNFDRVEDGALNGISPYIVLCALEKFKAEGIGTLSLGLSPLVEMSCGFNLSGALKKISEFFFRFGESIYPFKGNARHKSKFCGNRKKVYVASNAGWFDTMVAAATACGLEVGKS